MASEMIVEFPVKTQNKKAGNYILYKEVVYILQYDIIDDKVNGKKIM